MPKPTILIIRDGWGINPDGAEKAVQNGDATLLAKTPFHQKLYAKYPQSTVSASGLDVGLPDGQMGNSEVGHLNLGAGRVVYQDLTRINLCIANNELADVPNLAKAFEKAKGKRLHLLGLVSDGGVHSHQEHLIALAKAASEAGVEDIAVHAITDGRDTSPTGGKEYLSYCEDKLAPFNAKIITVVGRYYAMDRDKRWDRNKLAWDAIVHGIGEKMDILPSEAVTAKYADQKTDEFLLPMVFGDADTQRINDGDVVLWFNFRADRGRQLTEAFLHDHFDGFDRIQTPKVHYVTLTEYHADYPCDVAFAPEELKMVLGEVVSKAGLKQMRIAETEKYPHVTYFFNGGAEDPFEGEERAIIPSPKVATYDLQPEMSAEEVTIEITSRMENYDLIILNFANPDMVGHTGIVEAAIAAVEKIDACVERVVSKCLELGGKLLITADHGNCEKMINADGSPHTAHTTNLVQLLYVADDAENYNLRDGILADISPTLLDMLGTAQPAEMTGKSLLSTK
ncbi:MAG: 2,3-bisphosphoglycerate-independent phosphoglycerate mutase [Verrucomicrobiales bacterium]|jgi:2,3-bisphosphoglycerate-independent phosphoglycerate mutase